MKKFLLTSLAGLFLMHPALSALELSKLYGNQAVLQRDVPLPVTGRCDPGIEVTVEFAGQTKQSTTDEAGRWKVVLDPLPASKEGRTLRVSSANGGSIESTDVLVGDVWLASGQSNMAFAVNASFPDPASEGNEDPMVRLFQPRPGFTAMPHEDYADDVAWLPANPKNLVWASAPAWFFASEVRRHRDVPIGMVVAARGGTGIQAFLPQSAHKELEGTAEFGNLDTLKKKLESLDVGSAAGREVFERELAKVDEWLAQSEDDLARQRQPGPLPVFFTRSADPGGLYNLMLHPLRHFPIKGMLWYQGETNGGDRKMYLHLLNAYLKSLRATFGSGEFPVYIVQLAPFIFKNNDPEGEGSAGVREAQREVAASLPNSGLVVTLDIGNPNDIHPKNKVDVGKRLAYLALNRDYGMKDIVPSGPSLKSTMAEGDKMILTFDHAGGGLMAGTKNGTDPVQEADEPFRTFQLAGEDKNFVPATAEIEGDRIIVTAAGLDAPKFVRYAYSSDPKGPLLYNKEGLPASSFKTDPW